MGYDAFAERRGKLHYVGSKDKEGKEGATAKSVPKQEDGEREREKDEAASTCPSTYLVVRQGAFSVLLGLFVLLPQANLLL